MSLNFKKVNIFSSTYNLLTREQISVAISIPVTIVLPVEETPEARSTGPQVTEVGPSLQDIFSESTASVIPFGGLGGGPTSEGFDSGPTIRGFFGPGVITINPEDGEKFVIDDFLGKLGGGDGETGGGGNRYGPFAGGGNREIEEVPTTAGRAGQITSE